MDRKLGPLIAVCLTVLAFGALGTASASAALFHSEAEPTTIEASAGSAHTFGFEGGSVNCLGATLTGKMATKTAESITLTPTFSACDITLTGKGTLTATIRLNGCDYKIFANNTGSFECPAGQGMEFVSGTVCTVKVLPTSGASSITYTNNGKAIEISFALTGVSWSTTGNFLGCATTSGSNGTFSGTSTATGKDAGGTQVKIWHE